MMNKLHGRVAKLIEEYCEENGEPPDGVSGKFWRSHEGCQVPFRNSGRNVRHYSRRY